MTGSMQPNEPLLAQTGKPQQRSMPLRLYLTVLWALPGAFQFGYASVRLGVQAHSTDL